MPVQDVVPPDAVFVADYTGAPATASRQDEDRWSAAGVQVRTQATGDGLQVGVAGAEVRRVALRWRRPAAPDTLVLGDAWERSYGDLQWQGIRPERLLPWYWLACAGGTAYGMGVQVRARAFCSWTVDSDGVTLWLDLGNGGGPTRLGDRELQAATVVAVGGAEPWAATGELCAAMCPEPPLRTEPVVGCNNWYYAYGKGFDHAAVVRDAETIVELCGGHPVRPFSVVDAGWSTGGGAPGGPWEAGIAGKFDDLAGTAAALTETGARPGIWFRPLLSQVQTPLRRGAELLDGNWPLDPSRPELLEQVAADVHRIRGWGFELIKHDFSTYDLFGRFAPAMGARPAGSGPNLADPSRTNAEVLLDLYQTIKDASGDGLIIGCNTVGHLAAGLVEVQRIGDDTSGRDWERTRRMGINTLAFRLPQHERFFIADADCVPCTPMTDWALNRQFLDLVARSGTALFVSVDPRCRDERTDADLRAALRIALDGGEPGGVEPLDWLHSPAPSRWRVGSGERTYDWLEPWGADPLAG